VRGGSAGSGETTSAGRADRDGVASAVSGVSGSDTDVSVAWSRALSDFFQVGRDVRFVAGVVVVTASVSESAFSEVSDVSVFVGLSALPKRRGLSARSAPVEVVRAFGPAAAEDCPPDETDEADDPEDADDPADPDEEVSSAQA